MLSNLMAIYGERMHIMAGSLTSVSLRYTSPTDLHRVQRIVCQLFSLQIFGLNSTSCIKLVRTSLSDRLCSLRWCSPDDTTGCCPRSMSIWASHRRLTGACMQHVTTTGAPPDA